MAFAATTEWDVRATGSNANGGGFDTSATGTDRSQSDAAFQAYTDIVIGGTNTTITSAAHPFDSTSPGNIINITGGTGFTVQRVQVVSVAGAVATCDKAVGTAASTGGTGNLGGSMLTLAATAALVVAGNTVHVKAGTYTLTSAVTANLVNQTWIGYNAAHRDGGTKPLITTATNSITLLNFAGAAYRVQNISFSNTATTRGIGIDGNNTFASCILEDCVFDGFAYCVGSTNSAWRRVAAFDSEFKNYTVSAIICATGGCTAFGCWFHGGTNVNEFCIKDAGCSVAHCIFSANAGDCLMGIANVIMLVSNCTFYGNRNGLSTTGSGAYIDLYNNIFYGQSGYGILQAGVLVTCQRKNAFGANSTGNRSASSGFFGSITDDITLTANPFTNAAAGDFSLNSTAGGGAACKGAGFQWH